MTVQSAPAPPGWYPDPYSPAHLRWWDGRNWSAYTTVRPQPPRRSGLVIAVVIVSTVLALLAVASFGVATFALPRVEIQSAGDPPPGTPAPVSDVLTSTVRIEAYSCGPGCVYEGAGVAVSPTQILTAQHVVEGVDTVVVYSHGGRSFDGSVIRRDAQTDLAVVETAPHGLPVAELLLANPAAGDGSWVIGASDWYNAPITSGRVLEIADECRDGVLEVLSSADVRSGDSGGPMVDERGRVMGITKSAPAEGGGGSATAVSEIHSFLAADPSTLDGDGYLTRPEDRYEGNCRYVD